MQRLKERLAEIHNLGRAAGVLDWDKVTYMPPGGASARAEQLTALRTLAHRIFVDAQTERLLDAAQTDVDAAGLDADSDDACLVRVARRDFMLATRLPADLVAEVTRTTALAREAWAAARAANDFPAFAPWLEKNIALAQQQAEHLGYAEHPYDALIDRVEPGMTVERLRRLFDSLRAGLTPVLAAIVAHRDEVDDSMLHRSYDESAQLRLAEELVRRFGYDFTRGRLDLTVHPFATGFSRDDVRITTRVNTTFLPTALMSTLHEAGHGMYEQNTGAALYGTPLARGASAGVHESQSRLWENVVGRSRGFWQYAFPLARAAFPTQLADADAETFYRAVNNVHASLIRIEADEVTYNMHIMLRFELENDMLEGRLAVRDLPEAWNAAMQSYLGVTPPTDTEGALQDTHWSGSYMAYFPCYTIGNVLSVQLYDAAVRAVPAIPDEIARGAFGSLFGWMREKIYRHGRKYEPDDLITRATGRPMDVEPYLRYVREKFGAIYNIQSETLA